MSDTAHNGPFILYVKESTIGSVRKTESLRIDVTSQQVTDLLITLQNSLFGSATIHLQGVDDPEILRILDETIHKRSRGSSIS